MFAINELAAILILKISPSSSLLQTSMYLVLMFKVSRHSVTFLSASIALSLTTESSLATIISSGASKIWLLCDVIWVKLPSYSARFNNNSGLQSILSISSVSIGTSSSTQRSGPSNCAIYISLWILWSLAFGSSEERSSISKDTVETASISSYISWSSFAEAA